ncbi:DcrB/PsbP domain-containing protein [Thermomonospora echinospora]|uniref:hypothetical protein n=1 Tax=Thermomonospora echinospora TaxID=1992 RepID=UPI00190E67BB|nr:hypothetical protein [Thermomonospora echinospora]
MRTYFKVPAEWKRIDQPALEAVLSDADPDSATAELNRRLSWSIAYDAGDPPDPSHLYGWGSDEPFAYALVRELTDEQHATVSLNLMRNAFLPVTEEARTAAAERGALLTGFELLRDDTLKPGDGLRGVRVAYNYQVPPLPVLQTFDVTAYASDEGRLYVLVLRCSARCYKERKGEFDSIAESFTVRIRP